MVIISRLRPGVVKICRPLVVEDQVLKLCAKKFAESIRESLSAEHAHGSNLKCVETHVVDFPDGSEMGTAVGLDISGRVFRLARIRFRGGRNYLVSSRLYEIPETKLRGSGFRVVGYVARCVADFVETSEVKDEKMILGVSTGFPTRQESLQHAQLVKWSQDFDCDDFVKEDFFKQLKLALKKYKSTKNMYLISVTGDATSSLLAGLYKDPSARIGLVVDEQISLCYLEKQENITLFPGDGLRTRTAVNVDLRRFGDDGCLDFIKTEFDQKIDADSEEPGRFTLDKLISGRYLGEIFRLCLVSLIEENLVLGGVLNPELKTRGVLKSEDLAEMEKDEEKESTRSKTILLKFGYVDPSADDCCQIRFAARCVLKRSAYILGAFLSALLGHLQAKEARVCADGSFLRRFPEYASYLRKKVDKIKRSEIRYKMTMNEKDDIVLGAGLLAFIYKDSVIKVEEKYRMLPPMRLADSDREILCGDCEISPGTRGTVSDQFIR